MMIDMSYAYESRRTGNGDYMWLSLRLEGQRFRSALQSRHLSC
jgi:hypothetical protein